MSASWMTAASGTWIVTIATVVVALTAVVALLGNRKYTKLIEELVRDSHDEAARRADPVVACEVSECSLRWLDGSPPEVGLQVVGEPLGGSPAFNVDVEVTFSVSSGDEGISETEPGDARVPHVAVGGQFEIGCSFALAGLAGLAEATQGRTLTASMHILARYRNVRWEQFESLHMFQQFTIAVPSEPEVGDFVVLRLEPGGGSFASAPFGKLPPLYYL
jgi:hypothetical protein